ncbi:MAG TPA: PVC-type heme-binding CxxCH protein [Gemmataceae bacterium]|nr:PVC-type heme-binding CxxCH protein [Gemmataceae bacterium]
MLLRRTILTLLAACGVAAPAAAQKSPEDTVKSMTVADGLQVELFAAEPMLLNPTSIDVDHLGRVWVCEAVNYRRKNFNRPILRPEGDRIVIVTDKDGDGKADESTVFYQGADLYGPLGIAVAASPGRKPGDSWSYKVYVCQSPDILLFTDADGDGKADGPPRKFLTGFDGFDHDHGVHGINIGPDGKLYFTVGDSGVKGLQSADGKGRKYFKGEKDCQAGTVWRCDMDGTNLELIAHNFRNNYECCVNSFGEIWLSDNDDDGNQQTRICHVMPGGNYGYYPRGPGQTHWHEELPGIVHKTMRTGFGSPTGICFYEGTLLPKKYHGQLLHTDAGPRELRAFHIKPKGAGYELEKENLVTSTDNWFRLSDVCVAPDGSLMLADWYDPGVGGHGMGDWTRGRLYRVTPKGHKGYKVPDVKLDTAQATVTALDSPCLATRALALDKVKGADAAFAAAAVYAAADTKTNLSLYGRALHCLVGILNRDQTASLTAADAVSSNLQSDISEFRQLAVRLLRQMSRNGVITKTEVPETAIRAVAAQSPPVQREYLVYLASLPPEQMGGLFYGLAKRYDGQDIFYRAALNIACGTDPARRDAILADFDKHFPNWDDKVADLVWELRPKSVLPRLGKLLDDPKLTPGQKARVVDILAVQDDASAGLSLLKLLGSEAPAEVKARALDNLRLFLPTKWQALRTGSEMSKAIDELLAKAETRTAGLGLVAVAARPDSVARVRALAADDKLDLAVRKEAVAVLGQIKTEDALDALMQIGVPQNPLSVACTQAIGNHLPNGQKPPAYQQRALDALKMAIELDRADPEIKRAALNALAANRAGTQWLLQAREQKKLPEALVADAGRLLRNSPFQGERNKALILFPAAAKLDPKKLPPVSELVKRLGDVKRGEAVFKASAMSEAQCLKCHTVRGAGGNIGPDLSMIGKKGSKENLYDSLLTPSKAIADQYLQWSVETLDGRPVTGLLVAETAAGLTLRDANGKDHTFAVKDLDGPKRKSATSIMPDSLVAALTEDDLVDLVEYLMTLKTAALSPDRWWVMGPFTRIGNSGFDFDYGPEKAAFDSKATFPEWVGPSSGPKAKDLAWRPVAPDAKGYIDLAALHGEAGKDSLSYLYREIESPAEQSAEFLIGSDDGCKLIVNGEAVLTVKETRAAAPGQNRVTVKLKAGKNAVLLKVANGNSPHGAFVTILSEQELKAGK